MTLQLSPPVLDLSHLRRLAEDGSTSYYTVTPSAGAHGSISPNRPQTVEQGSTAQFTVTPDTGYAIFTVSGCGGTLSGNTYTTGPITADCPVTARTGSPDAGRRPESEV